MHRIVLSILACLGILGLTGGVIFLLKSMAPEAKKKEEAEVIPVVEVQVAGKAGAGIELTSEGLVSSRRETVLTAEVPGRIIEVDPRFEVGGEFKKDEIILRLDEVNYTAAVAQAEAALADAELTLKQEVARGEQAVRDWEKIGRGRPASEMVLRIPFLDSAKARVLSAQAMLEKAKEDLERTRVRAPFDCRVRQTALDLGATVAAGVRLGEVYDNQSFEVRLPFALTDYPLVPAEAVIFLTDGTFNWLAKVTRREGDLDRATLSAYLVARLEPNDENPSAFRTPLPGMFVKARVEEVELPDVISVPRSAVRGRDRIAVMNQKDELEFRMLTIVRSSADDVYVSHGVEEGDRIIVTRLEVPVAGMKLQEAKPESVEDISTETEPK